MSFPQQVAAVIFSAAGLAFAAPGGGGAPYIVTKKSGGYVDITTPMQLGEGVNWQESGDFTSHHLLAPDAGLGSRCEPEYIYKNKTMKVCVEVDSNRYTWGDKKVAASGVTCDSPPCSILPTEWVSIGRGYSVSYSGVEGDKGRYYFPNSNTFLPKNVPNGPFTMNNDIPFEVAEEVSEAKTLWFRALIWEAKMTMTTTVTDINNESKDYVSTGTMTYPVTLALKTLDGVYGLE